MADFTKYSNYNNFSSFSQVVFGAKAPLLEVELNEVQQIIANKFDLISKLFGDGIYPLANNSITYSNGILRVKNSVILCGSMFAYVLDTQVEASENYQIYFKVEEVTATSSDSVYYWGDTKGVIKENTMIDSRVGVETSRRKMVKYTLNASESMMITPGAPYKNLNIGYIYQGKFIPETAHPKFSAKKLADKKIIGVWGDVNGSVEFDGSSDASMRAIRRGCMASLAVPSGTDKWVKVASKTIPQTTSASIMFSVVSDCNNATGILFVGISSGVSGDFAVPATCEFLVSNKDLHKDFCITQDIDYTNLTVTATLWCKIRSGMYWSYPTFFNVLSEEVNNSRGCGVWELFNSTTEGITEEELTTYKNTGYSYYPGTVRNIDNDSTKKYSLQQRSFGNLNNLVTEGEYFLYFTSTSNFSGFPEKYDSTHYSTAILRVYHETFSNNIHRIVQELKGIPNTPLGSSVKEGISVWTRVTSNTTTFPNSATWTKMSDETTCLSVKNPVTYGGNVIDGARSAIIGGYDNSISGGVDKVNRVIIGGCFNTLSGDNYVTNKVVVGGQYNKNSASTIMEIGGGSSASDRANLFSVGTDGSIYTGKGSTAPFKYEEGVWTPNIYQVLFSGANTSNRDYEVTNATYRRIGGVVVVSFAFTTKGTISPQENPSGYTTCLANIKIDFQGFPFPFYSSNIVSVYTGNGFDGLANLKNCYTYNDKLSLEFTIADKVIITSMPQNKARVTIMYTI